MDKSQFFKKFFILIFLISLNFALISRPAYCQRFNIKILNPPQDRSLVRNYVQLSGTAFLPSGYHLWVLVSYGSNRALWWPISEARIDQRNHRWGLSVPIGGPNESGLFYIAVGPVNEREHRRLMYYMRQSGGKSDYGPRPIRTPTFSAAPVYRAVIKQ